MLKKQRPVELLYTSFSEACHSTSWNSDIVTTLERKKSRLNSAMEFKEKSANQKSEIRHILNTEGGYW